MISSIESTINSFVSSISLIESVTAIGMSTKEFPKKPDDGDIDIFIYCNQTVDTSLRELSYESISFSVKPKHQFDSNIWGSGDRGEIQGIITWIMYFLERDVLNEVEQVCNGHKIGNDNGYYPVGRIAMLNDINILWERDKFLSNIKNKLSVYPLKLKEAQINYFQNALRYDGELSKATARRDILFYHNVLDQAIDKLLQLIFALNNTYFPSRKRMKEYLSIFSNIPINFYSRILDVIKLSAMENTLEQSLREFKKLRDEVINLI